MQNSKEGAVKQFIDVLRIMVRLEIGDDADQIEEKEAVMVAQFLQATTMNTFKMWREYRRFPLFQLVIFGDHKGGSMVQMDVTPSKVIREVWQLGSLSKMLKEVIDNWDLDIQASTNQPPDIGMGQVNVDLTAYQGIMDHLKKKGEN